MAISYIIAGKQFHRRSTIALSAQERNALSEGSIQVTREVVWPLPESKPFFDRAYVDPGGTDIWGTGPYLKVPNLPSEIDDEAVNRVFCPWGYPPLRIRIARHKVYVDIKHVELEKIGDVWQWRLTLTSSVPVQ